MPTKTRGKRIAIALLILALCLLPGFCWIFWEHLVFWSRFESVGRNQQGLHEFRHRQSGIVFVKIPGGSFLMGSSAEELQKIAKPIPNWRTHWVERESPQHQVRLDPFLIAKYEVTQEEWEKFMPENPSYFRKGHGGFSDLQPAYRANETLLKGLPVEAMTWGESKVFCQKLKLMLPTEAQWEYACRAGKAGDFSGTGVLYEMGWQVSGGLHPPGLKTPNDFGLYDMHGNVCEWCEDVYDAKFYSRPEATEANPHCAIGAGEHVWRGGSWDMAEFEHRSAYRGHAPVAETIPGDLGIRLAYYPLP